MLQRDMTHELSLSNLPDDKLVKHVLATARDERQATAHFVAALAEFDARKLYLGQGCASLFAYCTNVLHLSGAATCNRTEAARAAARFPAVLEGLRDGSLTLTAVRLLAPVLSPANCSTLLDAAVHKSRRDIERLVATIRPQPDVPTVIRRLPAAKHVPELAANFAAASTSPGSASSVAASTMQSTDRDVSRTPVLAATPTSLHRTIIAPLSPERYRIQFTASRELHDKLRRAQDLLRHCIPSGDTAAIFERALDVVIAQAEKRRLGLAGHPRSAPRTEKRSRTIPAAIRRQVSLRDRQQCAFIGTVGRCKETGFLEFHHVRPYADGGAATVDNIQLRCRAHNQYEAGLAFDAGAIDDDVPDLFETGRSM
jgi:hypothetical protein